MKTRSFSLRPEASNIERRLNKNAEDSVINTTSGKAKQNVAPVSPIGVPCPTIANNAVYSMYHPGAGFCKTVRSG